MSSSTASAPPIDRASGPVPDRRRWWTLAVLCVSLLVIVIDNTIVNVALPTLVRDLGSSISDLQWVVDAYSLVFAGLLLTAGTIGDRYGRKGALTAGLVIFALASATAAFASDVGSLIGARAVMGIGAALIMPATLSILTNVFTDARERALAIGIWSGVAGLAVAMGPVAGGFLLEHFWWGSVFIVNVPIVLGAIVAGHYLVPTSRNPEPHPIDWLGAALSAVALVSLVWAIIEAPHSGWTSTSVLAAFAVALIAGAAFTLRELHTPYPMLNIRFFRNPRFTAASATIMLTFFALIGFVFLATQYLQFVLGFTPLQAGVRTLPYAAAMIVAAPMSAKIVERLGTKRVVVFGMLLFSVGLLEASTATVTSGYTPVAIAMVLMGLGTGLVMAPATDSIMGSLPPEHAGVGSAMNDTTREIGAALGVAVIGSVMSSFYGPRVLHDVPAALPAQARDAVGDSVGAASVVAGQLGSAGDALMDSAREAFVYAMQRASWVAAAVGVLGALLAWKWLPAHAEEVLHDDAELVLPEVELAAAYGPIERCSDHPDCVDLLDRAGVR
ncbi:MAG TPA: DHA2 family efflux MFS transporter permease subunit [Acidimicrobiia bacterium]|nr:DHA2 family efflux MFS transporter permease subunit [Acidimicrobiia bacterium]